MERMTRVFNVSIKMEGEPCGLSKQEASEYIKKQLEELYKGSDIIVDCVSEEVK